MKKSYNSTDINQNQSQELSKKLYRSISEQAKRLDDARSCARTVVDLFSPNLLIQRKKLCEYCERLIFSDPILYGRKGEELLWRKGYYDVVSTSKKLKKKEYLPEEICHITAHINAGIGFYNHMLSKLQYNFNLNIESFIDFSLIHSGNKDVKVEAVDWAKQSVHQCLIYLGDLSRYKLEIYPNWESALPVRYYLQAVSYKPDYGMPHNQMGTLAMNQNRFLEAVYHYMRCLSCKFPFEGTLNNLIALFDRNSKFLEQLPDKNVEGIIETEQSEKIKIFIARFLLIIDVWYFDKKVNKVYDLCHQTYKNLEECLTFTKVSTNSESGDSIETDYYQLNHLNGDKIFKIIVICLLCISKLQLSKSPQLSTAVAFTLGIYSQLLKNVSNRIREGVLNFPCNENVKGKTGNGILKDLMAGRKRCKSKLRRRKALKNESEDESELSEHEENYSSSSDSFISDDEEEEVLDVSSDEDFDIIKVSDESNSGTPKDILTNGLFNGATTPDQQNPEKTEEDLSKIVQFMDVNDILEIFTEETILQSIKILNDWLATDLEVIKSCGSNTASLLRQITHLLNLVNVNLLSPKMIGVGLKNTEIINKGLRIPLSEDILLKGVEILKVSQETLDWNYADKKSLNTKEEAVIRVIKLLSFGKFLTTLNETGISYDDGNNIFVCTLNDSKKDDDKDSKMLLDEFDSSASTTTCNGTTIKSTSTPKLEGDSGSKSSGDVVGGQLNKMKHMGQLWLAAEVRALENRVGAGRTAALSPYLVLDADALIKYTFMVKQLVHSRKFIVLVPTAVVSALDDLKREKIEARDAIRWLESQFHRGNRFFRAQRPQERAPVPFIKYPKKKDKEMHVYIQIIECCHFLAEQQKGATDVVTLLIGNQNVLSNGENKEFSYVGLALSVGIAIEAITSFYGKWKKSKGKR
ncbi:nonsense-mediated mRNA decay factor SMG5 [Diorhabda sublineata]|uniref:nonsense-mediated mRNA decay factor SMG5 n=1 Tax=Diorhabda sublineata TaxID=1163346 RepID=UPI0024E0D2E7|nr:nonsense-mediated mRNA decay factor SMG5 [Diorhabda sublineata]